MRKKLPTTNTDSVLLNMMPQSCWRCFPSFVRQSCRSLRTKADLHCGYGSFQSSPPRCRICQECHPSRLHLRSNWSCKFGCSSACRWHLRCSIRKAFKTKERSFRLFQCWKSNWLCCWCPCVWSGSEDFRLESFILAPSHCLCSPYYYDCFCTATRSEKARAWNIFRNFEAIRYLGDDSFCDGICNAVQLAHVTSPAIFGVDHANQ